MDLEIRCYVYVETDMHHKTLKDPKHSGIELVSLVQSSPIRFQGEKRFSVQKLVSVNFSFWQRKKDEIFKHPWTTVFD